MIHRYLFHRKIRKNVMGTTLIDNFFKLFFILMSQKCKKIITESLEQNALFKKWDSQRKYSLFHVSHYDWWAFPIDQPSSHGTKYQVDAPDLSQFLNNQLFIQALRNNSILVCKSWGYDLVKGRNLLTTELTPDQKWQRWPIRLYKMAKSLQLFQQYDLHRNAIKYGCELIDKGDKFYYMRDLSAYFKSFEKAEKDTTNKDVKKQKSKIVTKKESQNLFFNRYNYSVSKIKPTINTKANVYARNMSMNKRGKL